MEKIILYLWLYHGSRRAGAMRARTPLALKNSAPVPATYSPIMTLDVSLKDDSGEIYYIDDWVSDLDQGIECCRI